MKLKNNQELDLGRLVDAISNVEGVLSLILFGSRARGNYDEYSDYDILVIFKDDETMWKNRRKLYENIGKLGLFTQVLTRSLRELKEATDPTFLENVMKNGRTLYARYPLQISTIIPTLKSMVIIHYKLEGLTSQEKMKINYRLFNKKSTKNHGSRGLIGQYDGVKLGDGCFMVSTEGLEAITKTLAQYKVKFNVLKTFVP